jgi:sarcosine oxidase gamma subunit
MSASALWLERSSPGRRFGVKGPRAAEVLRQLGLNVPGKPNSWAPLREQDRDESPDVIGRLGSTEFFIEESAGAPAIAALEQRLPAEAGAWPVLREDFAVVLGGARAGAVLAEVCNVDFAALPLEQKPVVMTLMAGVAVLVLPQGSNYRIWCDPSFGSYLWETLQAIVNETTVGTTSGNTA